MHLAARHGLEYVRRLTPALLALSFFLLFAVLVAGTNVNGSSRWIGSGFMQIQPSELAKVALILYGADLLARKPKRVRSIEGMMPFLLVVGDLGAADRRRARPRDDDGDRLRRPPRPWSRPGRGSATSAMIALVLGVLRAPDDPDRALPDGAADRLPQPRRRRRPGPASRPRRRRSRSVPAACSASGSATASRRPSICPRPTPT